MLLRLAVQRVLQLAEGGIPPLLAEQAVHLRFLPEAAQVILCKGGVHLHPPGQPPQVLVLLCEAGEHLPQVHGGLEGADRVHSKDHGQQERQRVRQEGGQPQHQRLHRRVQKAHQQDGKGAPGQGAGETDVAAQIEGLLGVVPVPDLEQGFHSGAGDIFQRRGGQHSQQEHQGGIFPHRDGGQQDDDGAGAVNGQHGAVEKAPVYPLPPLGGDVAGLPYPAAEAVEEKEQQPLAQ